MFTIVVDGLGTLVDKAKYCDLLKSSVVERDGVVSQLQFADDTLFFLDAQEIRIKNLELLLAVFL